jgi:rhodanese-related sulfurtransferase
MAAAHIIHNTYQNVTVFEAHNMIDKDAFTHGHKLFILDVRNPAEYNYGHIEGATLIPLNNKSKYDPVVLPDEELLAWHIKNNKDLPENKNTRILVYCKIGGRGATAGQLLADAGYRKVYNMQDGIDAWVNAGYPIVFNNSKWAAHYPPNL